MMKSDGKKKKTIQFFEKTIYQEMLIFYSKFLSAIRRPLVAKAQVSSDVILVVYLLYTNVQYHVLGSPSKTNSGEAI